MSSEVFGGRNCVIFHSLGNSFFFISHLTGFNLNASTNISNGRQVQISCKVNLKSFPMPLWKGLEVTSKNPT